MRASEGDVTNFEGAGYEDVETGTLGADISITADYDCANNPFDNPPNLQPGQTISTVKLYLNDTTGPYWDFPSVKVLTAPMSAKVKEMLGIQFTMKNKGTFTAPTGSA